MRYVDDDYLFLREMEKRDVEGCIYSDPYDIVEETARHMFTRYPVSEYMEIAKRFDDYLAEMTGVFDEWDKHGFDKSDKDFWETTVRDNLRNRFGKFFVKYWYDKDSLEEYNMTKKEASESALEFGLDEAYEDIYDAIIKIRSDYNDIRGRK